jgi:hypothetical protein
MASLVAPVGPLFGPDFVLVTVNDDTGELYQLEVYPDAMNQELKASGQPTQYYFQPARIYLAKKQTSPNDFDFGMTVFKGLMTSESAVGVTTDNTTGGDVETGGGFCTFSTTFAVPDSVILHAIEKLKSHDHPQPIGRLLQFFNFQNNDPDPLLGIVPITKSDVTIEVPDLVPVGPAKMPMYISAQGTGKGSIEAHGFNTFLVTANELAAGAIAGSLKGGVSPFTVHNALTEQFYINGVTAEVDVDVDKVYDQFSAAVSAGGFLGLDSFSASYAYSNCVTSGGITTKMTMNGAVLEGPVKDWVMKQVEEMRKTAVDLVKQEIFDWTPREDQPASTDRGWFSSIFGGASVSMKASHQKRAVHLQQTLILNESIAVDQEVSGDLNDLLPAVQADLHKYLVVIDIGEWFKKVQVAGTSAVNFGEKLSDGTDLKDPIVSVDLQVSYPDYTTPRGADGKVNLVTLDSGFHYTIAQQNPGAGVQLAAWTKDNPKDVVNISFLRLDQDVPDWPRNQVKIKKTLVYDSDDPRVDISNGKAQYTVEYVTQDHAPILDPSEIGYVFIRFWLIQQVRSDNVSVTLTYTIGDRTASVEITKANWKNAILEIFSDKYFNVTELTYHLDVVVSGPNFTDIPVTWSSPEEVVVPLQVGRLKFNPQLAVTLPPTPADKVATVNAYIAAALAPVPV